MTPATCNVLVCEHHGLALLAGYAKLHWHPTGVEVQMDAPAIPVEPGFERMADVVISNVADARLIPYDNVRVSEPFRHRLLEFGVMFLSPN
jgi:hypothetical protein